MKDILTVTDNEQVESSSCRMIKFISSVLILRLQLNPENIKAL